MASNKNALIRYKTIDQSLRNTMRKWTLDNLIDTCSSALYEYEGKDVYVSKRTVQLDIQNMRSEKLGYNAPIEVYDRKYYKYSDLKYSIMNIPVTKNDVQIMNESIQILRQFKDFSLFKEMDGVLQRLEDSVYSVQTTSQPIIHLDKNENLKGLEFIDIIYKATQKKKVLNITYQSFSAYESKIIEVHPQLLKEFNNRWFVLSLSNDKILNLALDRIIKIDESNNREYKNGHINGDEYYNDVVGVTVSNTRARNVIFRIDNKNAPYVITKPFHKSQKVIEKTSEGVTFNIKVQVNFELERLILGFGESIEVIQPAGLRKRIVFKLNKAVNNYR